MHRKVALILSLVPLKPVKSGMQNTIFLLQKFLKKNNVDCKFINIGNLSKIDPVINLKFKKKISNVINKTISQNKPNYVFVNTSKLLYTYRDILLNMDRNFKTILVGHDLYYFRAKYFKKINIVDKTPLSNKAEIITIKKSDFIIDIAHEEKKYLISKGVSNRKIVFTETPIELKTKSKFIKKFDFVYLGSNWRQNILSLKYLNKNLILKLPHMKFLVLGMKKIVGFRDNVHFKPFKKSYLMNCNYGLAFIKFGSGRNVKIFEMISHGIPVITNKKLGAYGLKDKLHYIYSKNINNCFINILKISNNKILRKKISNNCLNWTFRNSNYLIAFKKLKEIIR